MRKRTPLICCVAVLAGLMIPLYQVAAYFAGDSLAVCWAEEAGKKTADQSYTVQAGDTLWSIARRFGVNVKELAAGNGIPGDLIKPGQVLQLTPEAQAAKTHRVARGETLWSLARRYQVNVEQLAAVNNIRDPNSIRDGQKLIIAGTDQVQTVTAAGPAPIFSWPLLGRITSRFGPRGNEFHHGLDIAGEAGEVIKAAQSGRVESAGSRPFYGETLIIAHEDGYKTLYAHLSKYLVNQGDNIEKGQEIGQVGATGRATGPHLHFEVRINDHAVDPLSYLGDK